MAETALSLVIDKLNLLLTEQVNLSSGVNREVLDIKDELETIRSFLRDIDARVQREDMNESMKTWVKQVKEVAYYIEDVIDEYSLYLPQSDHDQHGLIMGVVQAVTGSCKKIKLSYDIASKIQDVKRLLCEIKERNERYGFMSPPEQGGSRSDGNNNTWHDPRVDSLFIEEAELVGIETPRDELVSKLVEGASTRTVVSVVGMGGMGKTTLAKKVYDDQRVKAYFGCHAWITVSQSYNKEELLRSIIRQFYRSRMEAAPLGINKMDEMLLIGELREFLQQKRYVVVFDDVWKVEFWEDIEHALLDNKEGSRVIITTRIKDVADFCKKSAFLHVYELQPLPPALAWKLFCKKAFWFDRDRLCPLELEELSFNIVERCGGLPLAIVAIGGLMSTKGNDISKWKNLRDGLSLELKSNPHLTSITRILNFSYHDMPYHLKFCFLYFGMFPEDYSISCPTLMRLWIANKFINKTQGVTLEAVAEKYLTELIHRSLVQVEEVKASGKVKICRVHDLLHELILSKSEELSFDQVSVENYSSLNGIARHLSIYNRGSNIPKRVSRFQTRSIMLFNVDELSSPSIRSLFTNFKLLNVLDFEKSPLDCIPEEVGNLLCLSYLSIKNTKVKVLPRSIGKLHNLETLDLRQSLVDELPVEINRFPKLRYLLAFFVDFDIELTINSQRGIKIHGNVGCLEALQMLYDLDIEHASMSLISEFGKLKQLKKFGIKKLKSENGMALCTALEKMTDLESLTISLASEVEFLELQSISSPPLLLQRLWLQGRLDKLPDWIPKLKSLVKIDLKWSRMTGDSLKILEAIPNLLDLWLYDAYDGEQLHFKEGGFQKLKCLGLRCLNRLNELIIDQGALLSLEKLTIGPRPQLEEVPSGFQHLRNLKIVRFVDMPRKLVLSLLSNQGPDHSKIEHMPSFFFRYTTQGARYKCYGLGDSDLLQFLQS